MNLSLTNPTVLVGLFIGAMLAFVFSAFTMSAVQVAAQSIVMEVRRQFKEIAGIMEGKAEPDYAACVSLFMSNAGGAWDNAKKYIEAGHHGGKGSDCHKAAVVGDTVGDPFKDTSGPSLNILIKLCSTVSIVFSGLILSFNLLGLM